MRAPYLPISAIVDQYHLPKTTVYHILDEIETCDRYKKAWITLDGGRRKLVNLLVFEDYLHNREALKHRNLARQLSPYNPAEVLRQRGG